MRRGCDLIEAMMHSAAKRDTRAHTRAVTALLALSLIWALGSLRADVLPDRWQDTLSATLSGQALRLAVLAIAAALVARVTRSRRLPWPSAMRAALVGLGLFALPALVVHLAAPYSTALTRAALFALTPVFAVVLEPYLGPANAAQSRTALGAALAAFTGMLLFIPVELPNSPQSFVALGAVVLAALFVAAVNCRAVRFACADDAPPPAAVAAIAAAAAAFALSLVGTTAEHLDWTATALVPGLVWTTLVELPALLLLFGLMRRMTAARMTLRFILAPLFAGVLGLVLFRPPVSARALAGLALMAGGAGWLLLTRDASPDADDSMLHLR
ncbi:MAG TPA: DMT family transporter [Terracidiphilus sp.]|jgi:drug/metabolite transporter (DMT)-like permease|nr:DMT family transporter [Terracidiphilus sp.]